MGTEKFTRTSPWDAERKRRENDARRIRRTKMLATLALGTMFKSSGSTGYTEPENPGGGGGTPLPAATITRSTGVDVFPPEFVDGIVRPIEWEDGDKGIFRWSTDPTFSTGVVEGTEVTWLAATTSYNFGLSAITGPVDTYMQLGAWRGDRPDDEDMIWSNTQGVGDGVAPTITSDTTPSGFQFNAGTLTLTADKPVTWEITGGANPGEFTLVDDELSWAAQSATGDITVEITATSYHGVSTSVLHTLTIFINTANAFAFTDETGIAQSTVKTSNTITVAGIGAPPVAVSITGGTYSKNGGAYTSAAGTATNGDTFAVRQTSSASYSTQTDTTLTIGSTSDTYSVTTEADPFAAATWASSNGASKHANVNVSGDVLTGAYGGDYGVRLNAPSAAATTFSFEVELTSKSATGFEKFAIGIDDGSVNLASGSAPGSTNDSVFLVVDENQTPDATSIFGNSYGIFQSSPITNMPVTWQSGDVIIVEANKSTGNVTFKFRRSGVTLTLGSVANLTTMADWYGCYIGTNGSTFTLDATNY